MKIAVSTILFFSFVLSAQNFTAAFAQSDSVYLISGRVKDDAGQDVAGVKVCAYHEKHERGKGVNCAVTDAEGRFTLPVKKAGKYALWTLKMSDDYPPINRSFYASPYRTIPEVTLDDKNRTEFVSINLGPKAAVISGHILDGATNLPIEDAVMYLCRADESRACFSMSAKNTEGKFRVLAAYVPFTLRIWAEGFENWFGLDGTSREPINLSPGTATELTVALRRHKGAQTRAIREEEKIVGLHLPAPDQLSPAEFAVFSHFPRSTKLEWSPVEGAVAYRVEVDFCHGARPDRFDCLDPQPHTPKGQPPMSGLAATSYEFDFVGAQPGRWRVWAIDKEGREGFKSPWRLFAYTG